MIRHFAWGVLATTSFIQLQAYSAVDPALPVYQPEQLIAGGLNSIGDNTMAPLMRAWLSAFQKFHPGVTQGEYWRHPDSAAALGALMFETTDVAPLAREPLVTELAPYAHQFHGDMQ